MLRMLLELHFQDIGRLEIRGVGLVALQLRAGEVHRVEDLRLVVVRVLRGERLVGLGARHLPLALRALGEILVIDSDRLEVVALALGLRGHAAAFLDRHLRRLGVLGRRPGAGERIVHQDRGEAPGRDHAIVVLHRDLLEAALRRAVEERVQHRNRRLQLLLHRGTAGIGEIDLAEPRHAVGERPAGKQDGRRNGTGEQACHEDLLEGRGSLRPAPRQGHVNMHRRIIARMPSPLPLAGLKVVDLTRVLAGPFCSMLLGDMGADVIKVEEPQAGDDARAWGPFVGDGWSAYFLGVNRNKRGLAVDLKGAPGADVLKRLLEGADVFIENFRPGSLDKLGFGIEQTRQLNRRLVHCSISGYGKNGPKRHLSGYDPVAQAESGFMDITGQADGPPMRTGIAMTDYLAGLYAFGGILLALRERDQTGRGQHVDIALFDSVLSTLSMPAGILQATGRTPRRVGNDHPALAPYETLRAKDGMVMIACANPRLWKQLCDAVGVGHLVDDPRFRTNTDRVKNRAELKMELERAFAPFNVEDLARRLDAAAVPCGRVRSVAEALADPQIEPRQMLLELDDAQLSGFRVLGNPIKLSNHPHAGAARRPPRLGEHTQEILQELRGNVER